MAGILQTTGPVSTHRVVRLSWKFLRLLTSKQFQTICQELEKLDLGTVVFMHRRSSQAVFVKRLPDDARVVLQANPDLCSVEHYTARYYEPASKMLSQSVKEELVAQGHVRPNSFQ